MAGIPGLCLVLGFLGSSLAFSPDINSLRDAAALMEFKTTIWGDPQGKLATWNIPGGIGSHACNFAGITCDPFYYRVRHIVLEGFGLRGIIGQVVGNLTLAWTVNLSKNEFMGTIPKGFGLLWGMTLLDLSHNLLTGTIPPDIGIARSLRFLYLQSNMLSGKLFDINNTYIQQVDMSDNNLQGPIPPSYANLRTLQRLALSENRLTGSIPELLGQYPALIRLNLSVNSLTGPIPPTLAWLSMTYFSVVNNSLSGPIPDTPVMRRFSPWAFLPGNPHLCGAVISVKCPVPYVFPAWAKALIGLFVPVGLALLITAVVYFLFPPGEYSAWRMRSITDTFVHGNLIGVGKTCAVYKGVFWSGKTVAVKRVWPEHYRSDSHKFDVERKLLRQLRHPNIVKVHGSCHSGRLKVLVLEHMPNGTLDSHLHSNTPMPWTSRMGVIAGVAQGLAYLHGEWQSQSKRLYWDLNSSRDVLLDEKFTPRISDIRMKDYATHSDAEARLPITGYTPPEYALSHFTTPLGEVYRFGTLMLELLTGTRPEAAVGSSEGGIQTMVRDAFPEKVASVVDPYLIKEANLEQVAMCAKIALDCTQAIPMDRPSMNEVLLMLGQALSLGNASLSSTQPQLRGQINTSNPSPDNPTVKENSSLPLEEISMRELELATQCPNDGMKLADHTHQTLERA